MIHVIRTDGTECDVLIFKHKESEEYSFINLTKEHICPCKFRSKEEAIEDLKKQTVLGKVKSYYETSF